MADATPSGSGNDLATSELGRIAGKQAGTLGSRSPSRRAADKIAKHSKKLPKPSKAAEQDKARCQKALDREVARALVGSEQLPLPSGATSSCHNAERQFIPPQAFDSRPSRSLSPDGTVEQGNLPSNREIWHSSLPDPFSAPAAWQQPVNIRA